MVDVVVVDVVVKRDIEVLLLWLKVLIFFSLPFSLWRMS